MGKVGIPVDKLFIQHRITRPSAGYPESEARYWTVAEFEEDTGRKFEGDILTQFCDNCGYANGPCPSCLEEDR
jgi:hypothetical protein